MSEDNLSQSAWSLMSDDRSDKSVYRAGVEALVREGECELLMCGDDDEFNV